MNPSCWAYWAFFDRDDCELTEEAKMSDLEGRADCARGSGSGDCETAQRLPDLMRIPSELKRVLQTPVSQKSCGLVFQESRYPALAFHNLSGLLSLLSLSFWSASDCGGPTGSPSVSGLADSISAWLMDWRNFNRPVRAGRSRLPELRMANSLCGQRWNNRFNLPTTTTRHHG